MIDREIEPDSLILSKQYQMTLGLRFWTDLRILFQAGVFRITESVTYLTCVPHCEQLRPCGLGAKTLGAPITVVDPRFLVRRTVAIQQEGVGCDSVHNERAMFAAYSLIKKRFRWVGRHQNRKIQHTKKKRGDCSQHSLL